jgi:hypothetical protein
MLSISTMHSQPSPSPLGRPAGVPQYGVGVAVLLLLAHASRVNEVVVSVAVETR